MMIDSMTRRIKSSYLLFISTCRRFDFDLMEVVDWLLYSTVNMTIYSLKTLIIPSVDNSI